jgi:heme exporter protein C
MSWKWLGFAPLLAAFGLIFFFVRPDAEQGIVQKIFYIHVASAFTMYVGFLISFLAALIYLANRKVLWDEVGVAAVEVGFVFATVVVMTGPVWAKPTWGAWWTWDPRLTTTLLIWLLYAGYLILRGYLGDSPRKGVVCAVVAVVAALDIPLVHFSVRLWRGMHPTVITGKGGGIPLPMKLTLLATFFATLCLFALFFATRFRLERDRNRLARFQLRLEEEV